MPFANATKQFDHEKLDVYQASIELLAMAFSVIEKLPSGYSFLSDQLKRASLSIPLNIAEGSGRFTSPDKSKFYKIARGSANECAAIFDAVLTIKLLEESQWQKAKQLLVRIVSMLSKM